MGKNRMNWKGVPYISYEEYRVLVKGVEDRPKKKTVRVKFPDGRIHHVKV